MSINELIGHLKKFSVVFSPRGISLIALAIAFLSLWHSYQSSKKQYDYANARVVLHAVALQAHADSFERYCEKPNVLCPFSLDQLKSELAEFKEVLNLERSNLDSKAYARYHILTLAIEADIAATELRNDINEKEKEEK